MDSCGAIRIYMTIYYALRTITGRYDMTRALFLRHGINMTIIRVPLFPPSVTINHRLYLIN